jgi:hypothetical protein
VKNGRTRIVCATWEKDSIYLISGIEETRLVVDDFYDLGLLPHMFDSGSYREMDEVLAYTFFSTRTLENAVAQGRWKVVVSMMYLYELQTAIRLPGLSRLERCDRLMTCAALMITNAALHEPEMARLTRRSYGAAVITREMTAKILLLCWEILDVLFQMEVVYLGALGSHLAEHEFAFEKRLMAGHKGVEAFVRAANKSVVMKMLMHDCGVKSQRTARKLSDSGAVVPESDVFDLRDVPDFGFYMRRARDLYMMMLVQICSEEDADRLMPLSAELAGFGTGMVDVTWIRGQIGNDRNRAPITMQSTGKLRFASTSNSSQRAALSVAGQIGRWMAGRASGSGPG